MLTDYAFSLCFEWNRLNSKNYIFSENLFPLDVISLFSILWVTYSFVMYFSAIKSLKHIDFQ